MKKKEFICYLKGLVVEGKNIYQCFIIELIKELKTQENVAIELTKASGKHYEKNQISNYSKGKGFTIDTMLVIQKVAVERLKYEKILRAQLIAIESTKNEN